jgi:hypothetical protein
MFTLRLGADTGGGAWMGKGWLEATAAITRERNREMNLLSYVPVILGMTLPLVMSLLMATVLVVWAGDLPEPVREAIGRMFPNATIHEIEPETWNGQLVTEVGLTSEDGLELEVVVSEDGEILSIEKED